MNKKNKIQVEFEMRVELDGDEHMLKQVVERKLDGGLTQKQIAEVLQEEWRAWVWEHILGGFRIMR